MQRMGVKDMGGGGDLREGNVPAEVNFFENEKIKKKELKQGPKLGAHPLHFAAEQDNTVTGAFSDGGLGFICLGQTMFSPQGGLKKK